MKKQIRALSINCHETESKAFLKSIISNKPGIFLSSVNCMRSYIILVFSPMYLPGIKPVWSELIIISKNLFHSSNYTSRFNLTRLLGAIFLKMKKLAFSFFRNKCNDILFLCNWEFSLSVSKVDWSNNKITNLLPKYF